MDIDSRELGAMRWATATWMVSTVTDSGRPLGLTANLSRRSAGPAAGAVEPAEQLGRVRRVLDPAVFRHQRAGKGTPRALGALRQKGDHLLDRSISPQANSVRR